MKNKISFPSLNSFHLPVILVVLCFSFATCFAQTRLDSLKTVYEQTMDDSVKVETGIAASRQIHRKSHDSALEAEYAKAAVDLALQINDTILYAKALDNTGLLYRYHQNYSASLPLHIKAFNTIKNKKNQALLKMIFANNAGVAARYLQQYNTAIVYYMKALEIAEKEKDLRNISISSNGIGNTLGNISGREEEALKYYKKALEAEKERGNTLGIAMNYLSISDYFISKNQFSTAREYLNKLLEINKDRDDPYGLAITYQFFGRSYMREAKDMEKAVRYYQYALRRFETLGDKIKQADLLTSLGNAHWKQGKLQAAEKSFLKSLELAKEMNHDGLMMENSFNLAKIYEKEGNAWSALKFLKQGQQYQDSIKLSEQKIEIEALIRKYDLEKKENFIRLLQKDKALQQTLLGNQQQKLDRRQLFIVLLGIGVLLIVVIVILQFRNLQIKRKTNLLIQKEAQEKVEAIYERNLAQAEILSTRLQINPHFLFNSLNAIKYLIQSEQNPKAMKYLVVFSRYTRMVLETSKKHVVPLEEELLLTSYYLTLESNRFEKDFTYNIQNLVEIPLNDVFIPPLLLQPYIENAIWHGLLPSRREQKTLLLKIRSEGKNIKIIIDDNGVGRKNAHSKAAEKPHQSMGMQITQDRIDLYNKSYSSKISSEIKDKTEKDGKPCGTTVIIELK